VGSMIGVKS